MIKNIFFLLIPTLLATGCSMSKGSQEDAGAKLICGLGYSLENGTYTTSMEVIIADESLDKSFRKELKKDYDNCLFNHQGKK